jgi:HAD superfamily hydrolase (TIGR01509 family)
MVFSMNIFEDKSAFIFDMDGTLLNNEPIKGEALAETCRRHGGKVSGEIYKEVVGYKYEDVRRYFCEHAQVIIPDDVFDSTLKEVYPLLLKQDVQITDGAIQFINELKKHDLKTGLVSSAQRWQVNPVLSRIRLETAFDVMVTREDVQKHKPSPDPYLLALQQLQLKPNDVIVFEDSTSGLRAANEAGCQVIAIRHPYNHQHDFKSALLEINSFREIM